MATNTVALPYKRRVTHQVAQGGRKRQLFACKSQTPKEADNESVKTECLSRGYRLLGKTLGEGAYAKVSLAEVSAAKLARSKALADCLDNNNTCVAIKVIHKKTVPKEFLRKFLPRELDNHSTLPHHPHVVQVFENFSTPEQVYLVMEYCEKGDLLDLINKTISSNQRGLGEEITKRIFKQMCLGVQHIHNNGIVHRDLKCENILLTTDTIVKITDFGFSCRFVDRNLMLKTSCGSYAYTAPEVIKNKPYDGYRADAWSMGIILFAMVNGRLPYNDSQLAEMDEDMRMQRLRFERSVSFDCMVLIRKLLQYNPMLRPSVQEIIVDPWITGRKPIPRQLNKPKWINPYCANKEGVNIEKEKLRVDGAATEKSSPLCYHSDSPERGKCGTTPKATVIINQKAGETVTLKSRVKPQKYPGNEPRPQTWPKTVKERKSEDERLSKRRGKTALPKKAERSQTTAARLAQLLELTKNRTPHKEAGLDNGESSVPLWYMYKILQNTCKRENCAKPVRNGETSANQNVETKTGSPQVVCHKVMPGSPRKSYQTYWKNYRKSGGTVKFHVDKNALTEKLAKAAAEVAALEVTDEGGDSVPVSEPWSARNSKERHSAIERSKLCRERFLKIYGPNTPAYINEFPLPPLLVQRLEIQDNSPNVKQEAVRRKPCSAPATGNTSREPVPPPSAKSRTQKSCSSAARVKPVYKVVYHAC